MSGKLNLLSCGNLPLSHQGSSSKHNVIFQVEMPGCIREDRWSKWQSHLNTTPSSMVKALSLSARLCAKITDQVWFLGHQLEHAVSHLMFFLFPSEPLLLLYLVFLTSS